MILETLVGFVISIIGILFFLSLNYISSINNWIIETAKFIYYAGHPLLDDDAKFNLISNKFKLIFRSLSLVILKTIALIVFVLLIIALSSLIIVLIQGETLGNLQSTLSVDLLFPAYLYHLPFIIGSLLPLVIVPFFKKKERNESSPYSPIDKLLHYVFMGNSIIARFLFRVELSMNKKVLKSIKHTQNVYISGLARAGTTVLMQYVGQMPQFTSLSYRNLPFLFLPKTWLKITSKKKGREKERSHKDGMMHSIDSKEALEESFWRNYEGIQYIRKDCLVSHNIDKKVYLKYNAFRKLIAGQKIYLAKNNNHLLRAASLHQQDILDGNNTQTFIPFREPYSQAKSLLNQHQNLSQQQGKDEFVNDYMDLLVHHEFGLSHKVSVFDDEPGKKDFPEDQNSLEYWLEVWFLFYSKALSLFSDKEGFHFFCYEEFCKNPYHSLWAILSKLTLPETLIGSVSINKYEPGRSPYIDLNSKYSMLYNSLVSKSINCKNG
ncbi:MAG: hypothetical protein K9H64_04410 [Bacteroidales bacterium]|nr:hypothetical protein [Bacteroidales bacterium]MCF8455154.1 hypothetical protein [Bacteroidales bacterium]